jgi:hypothetical protein
VNVVVMVVAKTVMVIVMMRMIQPQSNTEMKRLTFNLVEIQATDQSVSA